MLIFVIWVLACHAAAGAESLFGKVMCGYQGWFVTPADGEGMGWRHYGFDKQGQCHIDLWPDVSELDADERVDTPLMFADGSTAQVFRSSHPKTVRRHFEWMRGHGLDGVFLQRFGSVLRDARSRKHADTVLAAVRAAAEAEGRSWCVMYDLSGMRAGEARERGDAGLEAAAHGVEGAGEPRLSEACWKTGGGRVGHRLQ